MTCVTPRGRISPGCAGMYKPAHRAAWKRIVEYVHTRTQAKIGMQLGHSGPKGSTQRGWEDAARLLLAQHHKDIAISLLPAQAFVFDGRNLLDAERLYAIGGRTNVTLEPMTAANEVYDPAADRWTAAARLRMGTLIPWAGTTSPIV